MIARNLRALKLCKRDGCEVLFASHPNNQNKVFCSSNCRRLHLGLSVNSRLAERKHRITWLSDDLTTGFCDVCGLTRTRKHTDYNSRKVGYRCRVLERYRTADKQFKISETEIDEFLEKQNYSCPGCSKNIMLSWVVDHDHSCCPTAPTCGQCTRGLLCGTCNSAIGFMKDNPATAIRLASYLESPPWEV